jgi:hypothetical protein
VNSAWGLAPIDKPSLLIFLSLEWANVVAYSNTVRSPKSYQKEFRVLSSL